MGATGGAVSALAEEEGGMLVVLAETLPESLSGPAKNSVSAIAITALSTPT